MKYTFDMKKISAYIKFIVTLLLFFSIKDVSEINTFSKMVVALLEIIIILELVRMLIEFLFSAENRVKIRLIIDSTIVFFIRDILLIVNDKFDVYKVYSILGVILILFIFRIITMKYSPARME